MSCCIQTIQFHAKRMETKSKNMYELELDLTEVVGPPSKSLQRAGQQCRQIENEGKSQTKQTFQF